MIPAPATFTSLGEHLDNAHYNPMTLAKCLLSYLNTPENQPDEMVESVGHDDIDVMHQCFMYREIIKDFVTVLLPFCEGIEE